MRRRFLITGGAGFIGSHLAEALVQAGHSVTVIDDLSTGRWENISHLEGESHFSAIVASIENAHLVNSEVPKHDFVYHLASAVGVKLIVSKPVETVQRIVRPTDILVEACSRYRRPMLLASTSEVYGRSERIPFAEDDHVVMGPTSKRRWAYACAKALDEFLVLAHYYQTSLPVYVVRLFNTVGPRQSGQYGMVLPRFVEAALANRDLIVHGDGGQRRCFTAVQDIVRGLVALADCPAAIGKVVNLGSNEEVSITELAKRVIELSQSKSLIRYISYEEAYGPDFDSMERRVPNIGRATALLGLQPEYRLDSIIRQLVDGDSGRSD